MEFTVNQGRLSAALSRASTATARGSKVVEIHSSILLRATPRGVVVTATDMLVAFTELVDCNVGAPGSIAIKASNLASMVKALPSGEVKAVLLPKSNTLQLEAGKTLVKLMGMSAGDFPDLPDPDGVEFSDVNAAVLVDLIGKTLFSVSTDEARVNINGALFESNGKTATMVSTDGHRLTKCTAGLGAKELEAGVIVPRRGLEEIRKLLANVEGECSIGFSETHLFVKAGAISVSVKLNRVTFPSYQQVVPKDFESKAVVSRSDLLAALRQATVIAPSKTSTVAITIRPDALVLHASNPELGEVTLDLPATWDGAGEMKIGMNGEYLAETLSAIETDEVELRFKTELDPLVVVPVHSSDEDPRELLSVVMPMRI